MSASLPNPPKLARAVIHRLAPPHVGDTSLGDFDEMFLRVVEQKGALRARLWFWKQAGQAILFSFFWGWIMLKNYLKTAARHVGKNKAHSVINISGLALGIACCILILLWIQDELSWDRFHEHADSIYRVVQIQRDGHLTSVTPDALAGHLKAEYPEVESAARYRRLGKVDLKHGENSFSEQPIAADPDFFEVFSFPFIRGNSATALIGQRSMVITERLAHKLFGQGESLGRFVTVNNRTDFEVTGIMQDVPLHSSLKFDCVFPFALIAQGRTDNNWTESSTWTYVRLHSRSPEHAFNQKIAGIVSQRDPKNSARTRLQPLTRIHLHPEGEGKGGPVIYVTIFSLMAVFVLLIACINFINLSTAKSANRAREVGLRKVVGARRSNLVRQFFGESMLFTLVAALLAVLLTALFLPVFNNLAEKKLSFVPDLVGNNFLILGIIAILTVTGLVAGSYPALLLSSFQPANVLRVSQGAGTGRRSPRLRRILVVVQFTLAIFLMAGTLLVYRQLDFIKNKNLGFDRSHIICSDSPWGRAVDLQAVKDEFLRNPGVLSVTFSNQRMGEWESGARDDVTWEGKVADPQLTFEVIFCDPDFTAVHRMEMAQGRFFSREIVSDMRTGFVLNQTAVKAMGIGEDSPLGKSFSFWGRYRGSIIGVIKDFHTQPLHVRIQPVILAYDPAAFDNISIRIDSRNMTETLRFLEGRWKELTSGRSFEYVFLDENLARRYRAERATGELLKYFTALAIFISCIGLLGLAAYTAQQRTKEIGIRKVMGASGAGIVRLLIREFVVMVMMANVVAWPTAYLMGRRWLDNFAYRTDIDGWIFALSGGIALVVALLTVSLQALKSAAADPVASLRYE